jgi:uncharacterized membrane protein
MRKTNKNRVWEIDMARGILIILMIILHTLFNLEYFYKKPINYSYGFVDMIRIIVASSFIFISGISTFFSRSSLRRGLIVLSTAIIITLATYILNKEEYIVFGILHMLAICMLISPALKKLKKRWLFILLVELILISLIISNIQVKSNYFFMFGLRNKDFISLDYYPLLPWSFFFVAGILLGKTIYREKKSIFSFQVKDNFISFLGRHSLLVYLIHQPVILAIMFLFSNYKNE